MLYKLAADGKTPIPIANISDEKYSYWDDPNRIVCQTEINGYQVFTAFLRINHNFNGNGPPILWETMIFHAVPSRESTEHCWRYTSYDAAVVGHLQAIQYAATVLKEPTIVTPEGIIEPAGQSE